MDDFLQASAAYCELTPTQQREQFYVSVSEYYNAGIFLLEGIRFYLSPTYFKDRQEEDISGMSLEEKVEHNIAVDSLKEEWDNIFNFVKDKETDKNIGFYVDEIMDPIFERIRILYENSSESSITNIIPRLDILGRLQALYTLTEVDEDKIRNSKKAPAYLDAMERARGSVEGLSYKVLYDEGLPLEKITSILEKTETYCAELVDFANRVLTLER